uniref:Uncharacterized protein n=1 Tax=Ditylenchus dipsaci TaxID=166011 RepID=A0A915D582_9BILA
MLAESATGTRETRSSAVVLTEQKLPLKNAKETRAAKIADAQQQFAAVLEYQVEDENFEEHLTAFLLHIGYNNRPAQIVEEEMEEEPAAEQWMDEEEELMSVGILPFF